MPLSDTFDPFSEEIILPSYAGGPVEGFPAAVLVTFKQRAADILLRLFDCKKISSLNAGVEIPIYKFDFRGSEIAFYRTPLGGPAAVALMEEVIAKGGKKLLYFGSCGVLDSSVAAGGLLIPERAYRDEGTSRHYAPESDFIEVDTSRRLACVFDSLGLPYKKVTTWTTDAFYRETRGNAEKRRAAGCSVVEMECASLMAAGQFRRVPVYQFLYAADSLDGAEWDRRILGNMSGDMLENIVMTAVNVITEL